jgi:hypothetical protein
MNDSKAAMPSPASATVWKQRYEALRQLVVGGQHLFESDPLGLVLLLRHGVAGWMRSWPESVPTAPPQPAPARLPVVSTKGWQHHLTQVLAEMSLAHLPHHLRL